TPTRPRRAAISSFGISGTNAHVILEEADGQDANPVGAPAPAPDRAGPAAPVPWVISARSPQALRDQARRLRAHVTAHPELSVADVGLSLATTRTAFEHRAAVTGTDRAVLLDGLGALAHGRRAPALVRGSTTEPGRTAFLFTGQGSQRPGMGRELYTAYQVFADALDEICGHFAPHLAHPLRDVVLGTGGDVPADLLHETTYTQPALFAVEVALSRLLRHWGVVPDLLIGHSVGELAAAHVAGVWSLPDAAALVAARGRLMSSARSGGAMVAIEATPEEITAALAGHEEQVSIAAVNGPRATVVSGDRSATDQVTDHFRDAGRRIRRLRVSHAFHSPHMDDILTHFRDIAATVDYHDPHTPLISNLTGHTATPDQLRSPDYWTDHIRHPVRFHDGIRHLHSLGVTTYLELGPDAVLTPMAHECLPVGGAATVTPVLTRGRPEPATLVGALAQVHADGSAVDWRAFFAGTGARPVPLPTYAFQHTHHWLPAGPAATREHHRTRLTDDEAQFWDAVGQGDVAAAAGALQLPETDHEALAVLLPAFARWRQGRNPATPGSGPWPEGADTPRGSDLAGPTGTDGGAALRELATTAGAEEVESALLDLVRIQAAEVLGHAGPEAVGAGDDFLEIGFSSFTALEVRNRLCEVTGLLLPPVVMYEHPTPRALAAHLRAELAAQPAAADAPSTVPAIRPPAVRTPDTESGAVESRAVESRAG
ncbi:acyltransferase domain-containing protein, partial [Frankia sp. Cpl3]|nr:acyltransferase domain-containing protein [Frankia sp. Cpl3]